MWIRVVHVISRLQIQQPVISYQEGMIGHQDSRQIAIWCQVSDSGVAHQSHVDLVSSSLFYSFSLFRLFYGRSRLFG